MRSWVAARKSMAFAPLGLFAVVLLFYWATLAPTVLWGDDAFFQRSAVEGLLRADGSGHWLWLQAAQLFAHLPVGDVAYRINLLSAVAAAGTVTLVYLAGRAAGLTPGGATVASVSLAVAHTFWTHAVRAEVYTVFTLLAALQFWCWLGWKPERSWPILLAAVLFGLTLLGHQMAVLLLPAFGFVLLRQGKWLSNWEWLALLALFAAGLVPFLALMQWQAGGAGVLQGLVSHFTLVDGTDFAPAFFDFSLEKLPRDAAVWLGFLGLQFVGLAGLLGLGGIVARYRYGVSTSWTALLIVYVICVLFAFSYRVNDQYVFYLPSYMAFSFFIGYGWQALPRLGVAPRRWIKVALMVVLVVVPIVTYYSLPSLLQAVKLNPLGIRDLPGREANRFFVWPAKNGYHGAADFGRTALQSLPEDSILIADYTPLETLRYLQSVERIRTDVRLVRSRGDLALVVAELSPDSPVFLADNNPSYYDLHSVPYEELKPYGIVYKLVLSQP